MLSYCLKCRKNTEIKNKRAEKKKTEGIMLSSNRADFNSKRSRFIKEQEANALWGTLGIKVPYLVLFYYEGVKWIN